MNNGFVMLPQSPKLLSNGCVGIGKKCGVPVQF